MVKSLRSSRWMDVGMGGGDLLMPIWRENNTQCKYSMLRSISSKCYISQLVGAEHS